MGIVETELDIFYISICNVFTDHLSFLYRLDMRSFSLSAIPQPIQVLQFLTRARALNGSTALSPNVLLVADSVANLIWRVDLPRGPGVGAEARTGLAETTARVWLAHESMTCSSDPSLANCPGINNLKYNASTRYSY